MTNSQKILRFWKRRKWLSTIKAANELNVIHLPTIVSQMRAKGHKIVGKTVNVRREDGRMVKVCHYALV